MLCAALAIFLMVADHRLDITPPLRSALATVLLPLQHMATWPVRAASSLADYGGGLGAALNDNEALRRKLADQSEAITRAGQCGSSPASQRRRASGRTSTLTALPSAMPGAATGPNGVPTKPAATRSKISLSPAMCLTP